MDIENIKRSANLDPAKLVQGLSRFSIASLKALPTNWTWSVSGDGTVSLWVDQERFDVPKHVDVLNMGFSCHEPWIYLRTRVGKKLSTSAVIKLECMVLAHRSVRNLSTADRTNSLKGFGVEQGIGQSGRAFYQYEGARIGVAEVDALCSEIDLADIRVAPKTVPRSTDVSAMLIPECVESAVQIHCDLSPTHQEKKAEHSSDIDTVIEPTANKDLFSFRGGKNTEAYRKYIEGSPYLATSVHQMALDRLIGIQGGPYKVKGPTRSALVLGAIRQSCVEAFQRYGQVSIARGPLRNHPLITEVQSYQAKCKKIVEMVDKLSVEELTTTPSQIAFKKLKHLATDFRSKDASLVKCLSSSEDEPVALAYVSRSIRACEDIRSILLQLTL